MKLYEALQSADSLADYLGIDLKKDYVRFLEFKNKYNFTGVLTDNFFLVIIAIITMLLPFLVKKVISWLLPYSKTNKKQLSQNIVEYKVTVRENPEKISLLGELTFCKSFYKPA